MNSNFKHRIGNNIINLRGWCTKRKIVIIESDDWGSIRVPQDVEYVDYQKDVLKGDVFDQIDSLATPEDLSLLFDVLYKFKDSKGRHPIVTADTVVANPDFKKIYDSGFREYFYEPFTTTLQKYRGCENSFVLWREGINHGIFYPQFHGREHLNIPMWLNALRNDYSGIRKTFSMNAWQSSVRVDEDERRFIVRTFNYKNEEELSFMKDSIIDGLNLFEKIFGFRSESFMAPCYCWGNEIEKVLHQNGVDMLQSGWIQVLPLLEQGKKIKRHYMGERNSIGQIYTIRNVTFEPSVIYKSDWIDFVLSQINRAFRWNKPAIISMHRVNCVGAIKKVNRDNNLRLLEALIRRILHKFPNVEFLTSNELGRLILKGEYYE